MITTDEPRRIGYILKMFPRLSETFVLNEMLELQRQQVPVSIFSLRSPDDGRFHARLAGLDSTVQYVGTQKLEALWSRLVRMPESLAPGSDRWNDAVDFLRRHQQPKELETLLRACLIAALARQAGVSHLHAHFATISTRVACLVHVLTGLPFSFTAHAKDIFGDEVDGELFAELARRAAFVVTVSDFNRNYILDRFAGVPRDKIVRLYNGIDLDDFQPAGATAANPAPHIISVGRLVPKKGFDHLLRALAACVNRGLDFRATIVGDGSEHGNLVALRDELGLAERVHFAGALPHDQVRGLGETATLNVLAAVPDDSGNMDALPTVLLESLAQGVPVVSTRLTGIPEIVGEECGILVPPGDDDALAEAIATALDRQARGAFDRAKLRARAEERFDLRRNVARLKTHFQEALPQASAV